MYSYVKKPEITEKLTELAESARYDVCLATCSSGAGGRNGRSRSPANPLKEWIYPASVPGQGKVHILKILQSNSCRNNCSYCRYAGSNAAVKRVSMSAEELSAAFMALVRSRLVEGIFLSSAVCGSASGAMEEMVKTAEILRTWYRFGGYIHLKVIPGCSENLIDAAALYADRLSINLEAPSERHLKMIAPEKDLYTDIIPSAARIARLLEQKKNGELRGSVRAASQTTQFVVGAAGERDMDILNSVDYLYRDLFMFRAYFSAFQQQAEPAALTSTEPSAPAATEPPSAPSPMAYSPGFEGSPLLREHRLYQCDFLMRAYGFRFPELVFGADGNIPLETDPKTAWAVMNPDFFPVEVNTASLEELLRVPGIGPVSAERIVAERKNGMISDAARLKNAGAWTGRAAGWVEVNGKKPILEDTGFVPAQNWLFEELAPSGWKAAGTQAPLIGPAPEARVLDGPEQAEYPGQKGKWVNYQFKKGDKKVWCR